jgi:hypothetical protein
MVASGGGEVDVGSMTKETLLQTPCRCACVPPRDSCRGPVLQVTHSVRVGSTAQAAAAVGTALPEARADDDTILPHRAQLV